MAVLQKDGVVAGAAGKGGVGEGIGEGDAFDGVDREHGGAKAGVQASVRGDVGTEADGKSVDDGDDESAERFAFGAGEVDGVGVGVFLRLGGGAGGGAHGKVERLANRSLRFRDVAKRGDVRGGRDAELGQEGAGNGTDGDAAGGLAGAGTLEGRADVVKAVLHASGEVGVAGSGHGVGGDGFTPGGAACHDTGEDGRTVGLNLHAAARASFELTLGEVDGEEVFIEGEPGGDALDNDGEGGSVRFTGGEIMECHGGLLSRQGGQSAPTPTRPPRQA